MTHEKIRNILTGPVYDFARSDLAAIAHGSTFLYQKEKQLLAVLLRAFSELAFVVHQYSTAHGQFSENGGPDFPRYLLELNNPSIHDALKSQPPNTEFELHNLVERCSAILG